MSQDHEQPEPDREELRAIVHRLRLAAEPHTDGCDREDLWGIAREMKRMRDQLAARHSDRPTLTAAEVIHRLGLAPPETEVVLHVGGKDTTFGLVEVFPRATGTLPTGESRPVVILSSAPL